MKQKRELVTPEMKAQIESTIWLQENHVQPMTEEQREYTRRNLENLVYTCLVLAKTGERPPALVKPQNKGDC